MKFFCKITLIIFFIFSIINTVKAENEIDKLELIERYIVNYKKNISLVVAKYEIKDNKDIKDTTDSLNFLLEIISKVKDSNMSEQEKERVVKFLTKKLKEINWNLWRLKAYFEKALCLCVVLVEKYISFYFNQTMKKLHNCFISLLSTHCNAVTFCYNVTLYCYINVTL